MAKTNPTKDTKLDTHELPKNTAIKKENKFKTFILKYKVFIFPAILIILLVPIALDIVSNMKPQKQNSADLVNQAKVEANSGNYKQAEADLSQALKLKPGDPAILSPLIQSFAEEGNETGSESNSLIQAIPYINQALKSNSTNPEILIAVGFAYETAGQYNTAESYYKKVTTIDPNSADTWFHLGHIEEFLGNRQEANADYNKAYGLDPNNPNVLIVRGNMLVSQGNQQAAFESFQKAATEPGINNQTKAEALTGASLVRRSQNNFEYMSDALSISQQAVDSDPNSSTALGTYGYNLVLSGNSSEGINYLQKAIAANPKITRNYFQLALVLKMDNNDPEAINYLKQAISYAENDNTLLSQKDRQAAKADYTYELAIIYDESGSSQNILPLLTDALTQNPSLVQDAKINFDKNGLFKSLASNQEFLKLIGEAK